MIIKSNLKKIIKINLLTNKNISLFRYLDVNRKQENSTVFKLRWRKLFIMKKLWYKISLEKIKSKTSRAFLFYGNFFFKLDLDFNLKRIFEKNIYCFIKYQLKTESVNFHPNHRRTQSYPYKCTSFAMNSNII